MPGDAAVESGGSTGGATGGAGVVGSGGVIGSGGVAATGGAIGTGGQGGVNSTGGTGTGAAGTGGTATGGVGSGGRGTGGTGTGGANAGGAGTGGASSGGTGTGGAGTGGRATGGGGGGAGGNATDPDLVLWYKFDESSGTTAADAALFGGTARPAMLGTAGTGGIAAFSSTKQVGTNALRLTPTATSPNVNGGYAILPTGLQTLAPAAMTIAVWINLTANTATQNWARVYDFGTGGPTALANMYLTVRASDAAMTPVRFAITNTGHVGTAEQRLDGTTTLSAAAWHHVVVVLPAGATYTGTLYIDGVVAATNPAMTLHMTDVGVTTNNWIGKSKFTGNPHFDGGIDDFRVYKRALSQPEITALFVVR